MLRSSRQRLSGPNGVVKVFKKKKRKTVLGVNLA